VLTVLPRCRNFSAVNPTTNKLEAELYARELKSITHRIAPHVEAIREILKSYVGDNGKISIGGKEEGPEVIEWLNNLPLMSVTYYGGYSAYVRHPDEREMPAALKKAILDRAVSDFLERVDSVEEVRSIAESAYHNSNQ
jgi:hypothetical protein